MALDIKKEYTFDKDAETNGVWFDLGGGAWLKVARAGNDNWQKEYQKIDRRVRAKLENDNLGQKQADDIISKVIAKSILLDWRGIAIDGEEIPYSVEKAHELLYNYPDFRGEVMGMARNEERFKKESIEDDLGNSESD